MLPRPAGDPIGNRITSSTCHAQQHAITSQARLATTTHPQKLRRAATVPPAAAAPLHAAEKSRPRPPPKAATPIVLPSPPSLVMPLLGPRCCSADTCSACACRRYCCGGLRSPRQVLLLLSLPSWFANRFSAAARAASEAPLPCTRPTSLAKAKKGGRQVMLHRKVAADRPRHSPRCTHQHV